MSEKGPKGGVGRSAWSEDREEMVLASPSVQATIEGETWTGTAEVLFEPGPRPSVAVECLLQEGVRRGPATAVVRDPERVTGVRLAGRALAGRGTRATFFDDNDGDKLLVTWRPERSPTRAETALAELGLSGIETRS